MSADSDNIRERLAEQLADLDTNLGATVDDVRMLSSVQQGIDRLLTENVAGEDEIRRLLEDEFNRGQLRRETYQLVKSMLDGFVNEQAPTSAGFTNKGFGDTVAANDKRYARVEVVETLSKSIQRAMK